MKTLCDKCGVFYWTEEGHDCQSFAASAGYGGFTPSQMIPFGKVDGEYDKLCAKVMEAETILQTVVNSWGSWAMESQRERIKHAITLLQEVKS